MTIQSPLLKNSNIRKQIIQQRSNLSDTFQHSASLQITKKLIDTIQFRESSEIALYLPIKGEVNTLSILEEIWRTQKNAYLPVLNAKTKALIFAKYDKDTKLIQNKFHIDEPIFEENNVISPEKLHLVITPLVGFDESCNRLGMGCGYYDRTFAFKRNLPFVQKPWLIGIAYELQKIQKFAVNAWDVRLDAVITETSKYENKDNY